MGAVNSRVNENRTDHAIKIPLKVINKVSKSICKIYINNNGEQTGTGFFMFMDDNMKCLITNYHIISEQLINNNIVKIKLKERYIQFFEDLDITIIEIKNQDGIINKIDFLNYDLNYIQGYNQYKDIDIFTLQYPRDDLEVASGKIIEILDNFEFKHSIDTESGSSGSPIILPTTLKVIGIHKAGEKFSKINYGIFIGEIFKNNKLREEKNCINYIIGEIYISKDNINTNLRIINSYEQVCLEYEKTEIPEELKTEILEELKNEKQIKECIIEINNIKLSSFSYFHKFNKEGKYTIKYTFKNLLTSCACMFFNSDLINLNLSNFNTKNVISMSDMFSGCYCLTNLNLSNFNTLKVKDMSNMFYCCNRLSILDLSDFNTENVTDMFGMFRECRALKKLNLSNFNTKNVEQFGGMFFGCYDIEKKGLITKDSRIIKEYESFIYNPYL